MPIDKYQVSLKVFLKDSQGRVLFLGNPIDEFGHADYCDLPGGRINVDEFKVSLMDILEREIREELGEFDEELLKRPEIILITKSDLVSEAELKKIKSGFKKTKKEVLVCSIYDYDSLEKLKEKLKDSFSSGHN